MPTARLTGRPVLEKDETRLADRAAELLGFVSVHFSQARASKQTPGIPDRLYLHPGHGIALWAELKRAGGKVSPQQERFHGWLRDCGHAVVVGPADAVVAALTEALREKLRRVHDGR